MGFCTESRLKCTFMYAETSYITSIGLYGIVGMLLGVGAAKLAGKPTTAFMWIAFGIGAAFGAYKTYDYQMKATMKNKENRARQLEIIEELTPEASED